jgi:DNA-binding MarR family transcriptional regulator
MVRETNKLPDRWRPDVEPVGTGNFANLLREPALAITAIVGRELEAQGFADLRPGLLAVGIHVRADGSRITDLARSARLSKPTVVHAVDELVRLGYARREPDPVDGRAKLVTMTERGLQAERAGREAVGRVRDAWAVALGEREMEQLEALLRRLRATLWPQAGSGATRS